MWSFHKEFEDYSISPENPESYMPGERSSVELREAVSLFQAMRKDVERSPGIVFSKLTVPLYYFNSTIFFEWV